MKLIIISGMIFILLFAGLQIETALGAGPEKAEAIFASGNYKLAAIEFERQVYMAADNTQRTHSLIRKSECYKLQGDFKAAFSTLSRVEYEGLPDSVQIWSRYQTALNAYLDESYAEAESNLFQLFFYVKDRNATGFCLPLYALSLNELGRWDDSFRALEEYIQNSELDTKAKDSLIQHYRTLTGKNSNPKFKNIKTAQVLSVFLPGAGHLYAGYPLEALASAGLNIMTVAFIGYGIYTRYYLTTLTLGSGVFQMFHSGASKRAELLVKRKNFDRLRTYNDLLKSEITSAQKLIK